MTFSVQAPNQGELKIKVRKSAFKNTDTYKDQNVETEQVWLN